MRHSVYVNIAADEKLSAYIYHKYQAMTKWSAHQMVILNYIQLQRVVILMLCAQKMTAQASVKANN